MVRATYDFGGAHPRTISSTINKRGKLTHFRA